MRRSTALGACLAAAALILAPAAASASAGHPGHPSHAREAPPAAADRASAGAVPRSRAHALRRAHVSLPRPHLPRGTRLGNHVDTGNWSGYVDIAKRGVSLRFIHANWNVPSVSCARSKMGSSGTAYDANWIGLDGWGDDTVEQAGTTAYCDGTGSSPAYFAWYELYPLAPVAYDGIAPGDAISATVYFDSADHKYEITLTDLTSGGSLTTTRKCPAGATCRNHSAEVIAEDPGDGPPAIGLADFGQANFTSAAVTSHDGTRGTLSARRSLWTSDDLWMENTSNRHILAEPGPLMGGQAFQVRWLKSL